MLALRHYYFIVYMQYIRGVLQLIEMDKEGIIYLTMIRVSLAALVVIKMHTLLVVRTELIVLKHFTDDLIST